MTACAVPLSFKNRLTASGIARQRCDRGGIGNASSKHRADIRHDRVGLCFGERVRRHSRVGNTVSDDANHVVVGAGRLEGALREIDSDYLVAILSVAASAIGFVQFGTRIDLCLGVTMLLRKNCCPERQYRSKHKRKYSSWHWSPYKWKRNTT
jgi:hypothetical protein